MTSIQQIAEHGIAFVERAGLKLLDCRPGYAACLMPLQGNENHLGTLYAGAQFTLADITGGALALASFDSRQFYPLLKQLELQFLRPASTELRLSYQLSDEQLALLSAQAERDGKVSFVLTGELCDSNGVCVTRTQGNFQVRRR